MVKRAVLIGINYNTIDDLKLNGCINDIIVMRPNETLSTVYQRMKLYDVSQLPIMDGDEIVGIIDESDVMMYVYDNNKKFEDPVKSALLKKYTNHSAGLSTESSGLSDSVLSDSDQSFFEDFCS